MVESILLIVVIIAMIKLIETIKKQLPASNRQYKVVFSYYKKLGAKFAIVANLALMLYL